MSPTEGGSIANRVDLKGGNANRDARDGWRLAACDPGQPMTLDGETVPLHRVVVEPGQTIEARAVRIGFAESPLARFRPNSTPSTQRPIVQNDRWGADVTTAQDDFAGWLDLLDRLTLAGAEEARAARSEALNHADPVRRWWAARSERFETVDGAEAAVLIDRSTPLLKRLEKEKDRAVRIQLAWSLGRLGTALPADHAERDRLLKRAFETLKAILDDPSSLESHKHHALLGFDDLVDLAGPLVEELRTIARDGSEYPKRVAQSLLKRLTGAEFPE